VKLASTMPSRECFR